MTVLLTKMQVTHKRVSELTSKEYQDCRRLNFRHNGAMQGEISLQRRNPLPEFPAEVFGIWEDDLLISWALVFKAWPDQEFPDVYFYTRVSHRQMGYGKAIAQEISKVHTDTVTHPHDKTSYAFFDNVSKYVGV